MLCPQGNMQSCSLKSANTFQIIIFCYCSSLHDVLNFIPENSIPCATNGDVYLTGGSTDSEGTSLSYICMHLLSKHVCALVWLHARTYVRSLAQGHVDKIRSNYEEDWKAKEMRVRQRAVAVYFIDRRQPGRGE